MYNYTGILDMDPGFEPGYIEVNSFSFPLSLSACVL